jgi:hypothetical protein
MESLNDYRSSFLGIFFQRLDIVRHTISWSMLLLVGSSIPRRMSLTLGGLHPKTFINRRRRKRRQDATSRMTTGIEIPSIVGGPRITINHHHLYLAPTASFTASAQTTPSVLPRSPPRCPQVQVTEPEALYPIAIVTLTQQSMAVPPQQTTTTYPLLAIGTAIPVAAVAVDAIGIKSIDTLRVVIQNHLSKQFLEHYLVEMLIVGRV